MAENQYHATEKEANGIQSQKQTSGEENRNDDHEIANMDDPVPEGDVAYKTIKFYTCENKGIVVAFYFVALVLTCFVLVVNQYIDSGKDQFGVNIFDTEKFVMIIMLISIFCIHGFWIWIRLQSKRESRAEQTETDFSDSEARQPEETHSITYLLGSVFVFAVGYFLLLVLEITDYFHCGVHLSKTKSSLDIEWEKKYYPTHFAFYFTQLMFVMAQLFFLSKFFSSPKLNKSSLVILFLVHLLATNVILALFFVSSETGIFLGAHAKDKNLENLNCSNLPNGKDYLHGVLHDTKPYLEPFVIEYTLIVSGLLFSMIRHAAKAIQKNKISEDPERENILSKDQEREEKKTRRVTPGSELTSDSYGPKMHHNVRETVREKPNALVLFVIGIVLGLFMIVSSWSLKEKDSTHYRNVLIYTYAIQIFVFLLEAISSIYILRNLPVQRRKPRSLKTDDRLLLISVSLGVMTLNIFTFIASLGAVEKNKQMVVEGDISIDPYYPAMLLLFFCIINIISSFMQTYTIIEAQRFKRPLSPTSHRFSLPDAPTGAVLFLLVINISHWIKDAFFELKNDGRKTFPFAEEFYHKFAWQIITRGAYPLCIFFRFHAAAMLFDVWRRILPKDLVWVLNDHNPSSQRQNQPDMKTTHPQQHPRYPSPLSDTKDNQEHAKEDAQQTWEPTA